MSIDTAYNTETRGMWIFFCSVWMSHCQEIPGQCRGSKLPLSNIRKRLFATINKLVSTSLSRSDWALG
jgi:hypothetical protein